MKKLSEVISVGKLVGSRGAAFRKTSTSKPDELRDTSGKDVGAMRNFAHEKAAVDKAAASKRERESIVNKRNQDAAQRAKETLGMAKKDLDEAKGKFVYDKPFKANVAAMDKHSTDALKGMHDRWASDHKDMKSNPAHSERLLAAHHVLKNRGINVPDLPQHKNLGMVKRFTAESTESAGTEARVKIKNVARPNDAAPTSEKSLLSRNGEIKVKKVDEEIAASISRKYGLSDSILEAARAVMEKKTQVDLDPTTDDKEDNGDNDDDVKKESKHTTPKSDKEKKLAALAHPKDKITHKDVLVGRGVLKKEDVDSLTEEQLEEVLKKSDPAGTWVKDFVHSKDPKFAGKSKKERMKMALGAYYAKQRNEEVEEVDEAIKPYVSYSAGGIGKSPSATVMAANEKPHKTFTKTEHGAEYKQKALDYFKKHGSKLKEEVEEITETSYERDLEDHEPRIVSGVKGVKSKPFTKRFPHQKAMEKWMDSDDYSNHDVHRIERAAKNEEVEFSFTNEEIERLEAIAAQLDEAKPTIVSAPIRGANQDQSGFGVKSNTADYTISDSKMSEFKKLAARRAWQKNPANKGKPLPTHLQTDQQKQKSQSKVTKEEVDLDEARGRPKKSGDAPEGDDTAKHPIQQLHKIATGIQGNEPHFEHKDGSKTKVSKQLARHITAVYGSMRTTQDKEDFANKLHANRQSMMTAVDKHVR